MSPAGCHPDPTCSNRTPAGAENDPTQCLLFLKPKIKHQRLHGNDEGCWKNEYYFHGFTRKKYKALCLCYPLCQWGQDSSVGSVLGSRPA